MSKCRYKSGFEAHSLNDSVDHLDTGRYFILGVSNNQAMKILLRILSVLVRSSLSFLDTAFTAYTDFGTAVTLHLFKTITARTDQQTKEVDLGKFFDWYINLLGRSLRTFLLMIFHWRTEVGIILHGAIH